MPISVRRDIPQAFKLSIPFSLRDIPQLLTGGSCLAAIKPRIADEKWDEFYTSWNINSLDPISNTRRNVLKSIARQFNLSASEEGIFDDLWNISEDSLAYKKQEEANGHIPTDIALAYRLVALIATGKRDISERTFRRIDDRNDDNFVIFSDHHMTAFRQKPNYFKDFNFVLYLDVLRHYAKTDFCLVENGDVEECIIYEPTSADANLRKIQSRQKTFPITPDNENWAAYLDTRYGQRLKNLVSIIEEFQDYYELLRTDFISREKYVRLTGNHDTYLDDKNDEYEGQLRDCIEDELDVKVLDVLTISRSGNIKYVVLHGHQFDSACIQHGSIPYAKSLGETYSECVGWAFQGPDRVWTLQDTKKWYIGSMYLNRLSREEHGLYYKGTDGIWDLVWGNKDRIKADSKDWVETLIGEEIAWEYFENNDGFEALTLEVWTGEEIYKLRHLNEIKLCGSYAAEFGRITPGLGKPLPKLVLGHTHEPRQNARDLTSGGNVSHYLNSGSAGRYQNLIWCVEIVGEEDRICCWSKVGDRLKKIVWKSEQDWLMHDFEEWFNIAPGNQ